MFRPMTYCSLDFAIPIAMVIHLACIPLSQHLWLLIRVSRYIPFTFKQELQFKRYQMVFFLSKHYLKTCGYLFFYMYNLIWNYDLKKRIFDNQAKYKKHKICHVHCRSNEFIFTLLWTTVVILQNSIGIQFVDLHKYHKTVVSARSGICLQK